MTEETLFAAVLEQSPADRTRFLEEARGTDAALRQRVRALLAAHDKAVGILDQPAPSPAMTASYATRGDVGGAEVGSVIAGRYKLLEQIGEGGMGAVWVAEQTQPVRRKVAVKLIKAGMDSKAVLSRFEAERQALAVMDHPNIAKVLDGGTTDNGRPYFVMEYVKGVPFTKYCDDARLSVAERLALFVSVCHAVQHAHQKGIIHRDLKPSNILVCLYDGQPVPKVIDFGLAKAIHQPLTEHTLHTAHGVMMGTPLYMSPEQAEFNNLDVDTRTDIYALGVVLYELLTGSTPLESQRFKVAALQEMLRLIKDEEPPKPSARLSGSGSLPNLAAQRRLDPSKLAKLLRGELDWIVMKALEKDRSRRYETANGFARDVQRYLADESVEACPPSTVYRLKKILRRNKGPVLATSLVMLALLVGVIGTSMGLLEARSQRDSAEYERRNALQERDDKDKAFQAEAAQRRIADANKKEAEVQEKKAQEAATAERSAKLAAQESERLAKTARDRAEEEKRIAQAVRDFLRHKLLAQADAGNQADALLLAGGLAAEATENPTIRELLDRAAKELVADKIEANFPNQPLVQAEILSTVGNTYRMVGAYERSIEFLHRSASLRKTNLGADHPFTLTALNDLALAYADAGNLHESIALFAQVHEAKVKKLGAGHSSTLNTLHNLAVAYTEADNSQKAIALFEQARDARVMEFGADHPATLHVLHNLAVAHKRAGKSQEATALFEQVRDARARKLGADHPSTLTTLNSLALEYQAAGKLREATALFEQVRDTRVKMHGADHPSTLNTLHNLAHAYQDAGRLQEATALFELVRDARVKKLGADHSSTLTTQNSLALAYLAAGKLQAATALFELVRDARVRKLGADHSSTLTTLSSLALAYQAAGKLREATALFEQVRDTRVKMHGADHPATLATLHNLARAYKKAGKLQEAIALFEQVRDAEVKKLGADHPSTLETLNSLATVYWSAKQLDKSVPLFEDVLKRRQAKLGRQHPDTLLTVANLGVNYKDANRLTEAIPLLEEAYRASHTMPTLRWVGAPLLEAYLKAGKSAEAVKLVPEQLADARQALPKGSVQLAGSLVQYSLTLLRLKAYADAEPLLRECLAIREKAQPDAWTTFNTQSLLGGALFGQKKYADAEPLLLAGYEGMKQRERTIPPLSKERLSHTAARLVELYDATGNMEKAAQWRKKLEEAKSAQKLAAP